MHSIQNGFYNGFNHFLFCFSISSIFSPLNWFLIHQASLSYYPRSLYYWRVIIFYSSIAVAKFQQERSATHQEVSPISSLTKFLGQNIWDRETAMEYPKVPPYIHTAKETQRKCCCAIRAASPTRHLNPQQQKHFFATLKSIHFSRNFPGIHKRNVEIWILWFIKKSKKRIAKICLHCTSAKQNILQFDDFFDKKFKIHILPILTYLNFHAKTVQIMPAKAYIDFLI